MTEFKITAKTRDQKPNKTRQDGFIPANIYGKNFSNQSIALEKINFMRTFKEAGTSNLIELSVDEEKGLNTLIHEVQLDPIRSEVLHVDFFKVNMKEKIHTEIPLEFFGDSPAVMNFEGTLITSKDSIEVECLPADLIPELKIDISVLDDFEKNIKVEDLVLPAGIEVLDEPEEVIAFVQEPRSEEELEALNEEVVEDVDKVEVENKGEEAPVEGEEVKETKEETKKEE